jgi:CYTH domain-containing protein
MNQIEIERKYLVTGEFKHLAENVSRICQGYMISDKQRTVRIRIKNEKGYITIKGKSKDGGLSRFEFEQEIALTDAEMLLKLCNPGVIIKNRYEIPWLNHVIEVDIFEGDNDGLILAEIEYSEVKTQLNLPEWLGEEVTGKRQYYNSYLIKNPYKSWQNENL